MSEAEGQTDWEMDSIVINAARALRDFAVKNHVPFNWRHRFRGGWEINRSDGYNHNGDYVAHSLVVGVNGKLRLYRMGYSGIRRIPLILVGYEPTDIKAAVQNFISAHQVAG